MRYDLLFVLARTVNRDVNLKEVRRKFCEYLRRNMGLEPQQVALVSTRVNEGS